MASDVDTLLPHLRIAMHTSWLRGTATALVTPFQADGSLDLDALRRLVRFQIDGGVRLLVPVGTTGESATTTAEEDQLIVNTVVDAAAGQAKVIAGIGSNNTAVAIANAHRAKEAGADAFLAVAPYYNKPTQAGLEAHYRAIASAHPDVPIVLYNVPGRTSSNLSADTCLRLAEVDNVVAVKEASGNFSQIMDILRRRPEGFAVLSGDDATTLPLIAVGADGLVSVASNQVPDLMSAMVEHALDGRWDEARALHNRLLPLMEGNFIETSPGPVKAALAMMGLIEENLRLPLVPVQESTRTQMRGWLEDLGVLVR